MTAQKPTQLDRIEALLSETIDYEPRVLTLGWVVQTSPFPRSDGPGTLFVRADTTPDGLVIVVEDYMRGVLWRRTLRWSSRP